MSVIIKDPQLHFELVDYSRPELHRTLLKQFHALCALEFNETELERIDVWDHILTVKNDPNYPYTLSFTIVFCYSDDEKKHDDAVEEKSKSERKIVVLGGAQQEYYGGAANCALLPYVVVARLARGMGLAKRLVNCAWAFMQQQSSSSSSSSGRVQEMLIEVSQMSECRDDGTEYHSVAAASMRQAVWTKIGFLPVHFSVVHPGYLKGTVHQFAAYRPKKNDDDEEEEETKRRCRPIPTKTMLALSRAEFKGILVQGENPEDLREKAKQGVLPEDVEAALLREAGDRDMIEVGGDWR